MNMFFSGIVPTKETTMEALEYKGTEWVGVAIVHMFTYMVFTWMAYMFSGALFNPAITIVLLCFRKITVPKGVFYLIAQFTASVVAASLIRAIAPETKVIAFGEKGFLGFPNTTVAFIPTLIYEGIGTCIIICVYYTNVVSKKSPKMSYGSAMGAAYGAMILVIGPYTGAACNPARIFGPAIIEKKYFNLFEYYLGHLGGSLLGAFISETVLLPSAEKGDMLLEKGAQVEVKTKLVKGMEGEYNAEQDIDDDDFVGTNKDLLDVEKRNRDELEERDKKNILKYAYENSSDDEETRKNFRQQKAKDKPADYEKEDYVPKIYSEKEVKRDPNSKAEIVTTGQNAGNTKRLIIEKKFKEEEIDEELTEEQKRQLERNKKLNEERLAAEERARQGKNKEDDEARLKRLNDLKKEREEEDRKRKEEIKRKEDEEIRKRNEAYDREQEDIRQQRLAELDKLAKEKKAREEAEQLAEQKRREEHEKELQKKFGTAPNTQPSTQAPPKNEDMDDLPPLDDPVGVLEDLPPLDDDIGVLEDLPPLDDDIGILDDPPISPEES